jgi:hypothetical protein
VEPEHVSCPLERIYDPARQHWTDVTEAVFEGRDDAEVSPTAAHPQKRSVFSVALAVRTTIRSDDIDAEELSHASPYLPASQPRPPPWEKPKATTPVVEVPYSVSREQSLVRKLAGDDARQDLFLSCH